MYFSPCMIHKIVLMAVDVLTGINVGLFLFDIGPTRFYWLFFLAFLFVVSANLKKPTSYYYLCLALAVFIAPFVRNEYFTLLLTALIFIKGFKNLL